MMITFYRTAADGSLNYYTLNDRQRHLFSKYSFAATWGRQLTAGREKLYTFETAGEMEQKLRQIIRQRLRGGYKVLYSYFEKSQVDASSYTQNLSIDETGPPRDHTGHVRRA